MNVKGLKKQLKDMGLPTDGNKSVLEFRLAGALKYEELVDEDAIEEEIIEEVVEEEIAEEIAEEEEAPVEEEEVVEEKPEEPNMDGGPDCKCSWCANGYSHR